jgi:hypothetical protein
MKGCEPLANFEMWKYTRTDVTSRASSAMAPSEHDRIVSPASESVRRTLPHSSMIAFFKAMLTCPMIAPVLVESAAAMEWICLESGRLGNFGGRRTQVGSAEL